MAFWNFWRKKPEQRTDGAEFDYGRIPAPNLTGQARADEWLNIITGQGQQGRDKRVAAEFICQPVTHAEARELWRGDDIVKKVIELLPKAMVREGYQVKTDDNELSGNISDYIDTLRINRVFALAKMYERAYGGAAIWPVLNDGAADLAEPLREQSIATIRSFIVFEPRELVPNTWYEDPGDKYGTPETYRLVSIATGGSMSSLQTIIHESRLVVFPGIRVSRELPQVESWGWGDSVLTRVRSVLRDFHMSWASAAALLADFSQGVFKYAGLTEMILKKQDDAIKRKLGVMDYSRSVFQSLVIDKEDDFERKSTPMSGASEILVQFITRLAAACDTPATKLAGISPAGMNATGESDTRGWYETVGEEQEQDRPLLEQLIRFGLLALDGPANGNEPDTWRVTFNPMWAPSDKEQAETRKTVAETDQILIDTGQATGDELARSHYGGDEYSPDIHIDFEERDRQANAGASDIAAGAAGVGSPLGAAGDVQAEALNGAQIAALLSIMEKVAAKAVPRDGAAVLIQLAIPKVTEEKAKALLGSEDFQPVVAAKPAPFGGNAAPKPDPSQPPADPNADPKADPKAAAA